MLFVYMSMLIGRKQIGNVTTKTAGIDNAIQEVRTQSIRIMHSLVLYTVRNFVEFDFKYYVFKLLFV